MTDKQMYLYALQKWEWLCYNWDYSKSYNDNTANAISDIPTLLHLKHNCSFCERYVEHMCYGCPLYGAYGCITCQHILAPYAIWSNETTSTARRQTAAESLRDTIQTIAKEAGYAFTDKEIGVLPISKPAPLNMVHLPLKYDTLMNEQIDKHFGDSEDPLTEGVRWALKRAYTLGYRNGLDYATDQLKENKENAKED